MSLQRPPDRAELQLLTARLWAPVGRPARLSVMSTLSSGASNVTGLDDLLVRASLLWKDVGLGDRQARFRSNLDSEMDEEKYGAWLAGSSTNSAIACMRRFAVVEANVQNKDLKGVGRISSSSFPRMGGVISKSAHKAGVSSSEIQSLVERTVQSGYLCLLLIHLLHVGNVPEVVVTDEEKLWKLWIPMSYQAPTGWMDEVSHVAAFVSFWSGGLKQLGMNKVSSEVTNQRSDVCRSLSGLVGVGVTLALAERGFVD